MKNLLLATAATIALSTSAFAGDINDGHGQIVAVGDVSGSVYYTEGSDEFEVVATLSAADSERSIRTRASLRDGQSISVEVPGESGTNSETITITRDGDHLSVTPEADLRASLIAQ